MAAAAAGCESQVASEPLGCRIRIVDGDDEVVDPE